MEIDNRFFSAAAAGSPPASHQPFISTEQAVGEFRANARLQAALIAGEVTEDDYIRISDMPNFRDQLAETEKWAHLVPEEK